jgi:hypothetical protein
MKPEGLIECQSAGWVLFSAGRRLVFADRDTSWRRVVLFVLALLALIFTANGVYWIATGMRFGSGLVLGAVLTAAGVLAGVAARWTWTVEKEDLKTVPSRDQWVLVIDLEARQVEARHGEILAPLDAVRFSPVAQMGSSSRALVATWPSGSAVVYRGNPFGGSWTAARDVLRRYDVETG